MAFRKTHDEPSLTLKAEEWRVRHSRLSLESRPMSPACPPTDNEVHLCLSIARAGSIPCSRTLSRPPTTTPDTNEPGPNDADQTCTVPNKIDQIRTKSNTQTFQD